MFRNYKGTISISFTALTDANYNFIAVDISAPGTHCIGARNTLKKLCHNLMGLYQFNANSQALVEGLLKFCFLPVGQFQSYYLQTMGMFNKTNKDFSN